jgi:GNAT superfamily N-acetyltransferase
MSSLGKMMTVSIRDATMADMEALGDVFRRASVSNPGDRASLLANPEALDLSDLAVREGRTRVAVVEDGSILGFATTTIAVDCTIELEDLFVDPMWRSRGVARTLVWDVVAKARSEGVNRMEVVANRHALAFYEAVGFAVDGVTETRFGKGLLMHLDIVTSKES